jgi:hypothetical protein
LALEQVSGTRIVWKTGTNATTATAPPAASQQPSGGGFLSSLFQGVGSFSLGNSSSAGQQVGATLTVRDDANGDPELFVDPHPSENDNDSDGSSSGDVESASGAQLPGIASSEEGGSSAVAPAPVGYKLSVRIRRVDRVTLQEDSGDVVLLARKVDPSQPAKALLRFSLPASAGTTDERRNLLVHHLAVLVEWERQRRIASGEAGGDDDEDGDDQPNFLRARAQKAAHFARRELELQQTRRERERRKAQLVQESGGLKYTALAMASRGESA